MWKIRGRCGISEVDVVDSVFSQTRVQIPHRKEHFEGVLLGFPYTLLTSIPVGWLQMQSGITLSNPFRQESQLLLGLADRTSPQT